MLYAKSKNSVWRKNINAIAVDVVLVSIWPDVLEYVKEGYSFCSFTASLGKLVFWWKFNCCFESRRQPLAEKLFTKAPSKEMLCQSCFSTTKEPLSEKSVTQEETQKQLGNWWVFFLLMDLLFKMGQRKVVWSVSNTSENWESFPPKLPACHPERWGNI